MHCAFVAIEIPFADAMIGAEITFHMNITFVLFYVVFGDCPEAAICTVMQPVCLFLVIHGFAVFSGKFAVFAMVKGSMYFILVHSQVTFVMKLDIKNFTNVAY